MVCGCKSNWIFFLSPPCCLFVEKVASSLQQVHGLEVRKQELERQLQALTMADRLRRPRSADKQPSLLMAVVMPTNRTAALVAEIDVLTNTLIQAKSTLARLTKTRSSIVPPPSVGPAIERGAGVGADEASLAAASCVQASLGPTAFQEKKNAGLLVAERRERQRRLEAKNRPAVTERLDRQSYAEAREEVLDTDRGKRMEPRESAQGGVEWQRFAPDSRNQPEVKVEPTAHVDSRSKLLSLPSSLHLLWQQQPADFGGKAGLSDAAALEVKVT